MDDQCFTIYPQHEGVLTRLSPDELYEIVCAIFNYINYGTEPDFSQGPCFENERLLNIVWKAILEIGAIHNAE